MIYKALLQRAMLLPDKITLVIKIADDKGWSGEIRLTNEVKCLSKKRSEMLKKVLLSISEFVTEVYEV